jgi:rhodanese-related sulfurtransferase/biotin operon repressor
MNKTIEKAKDRQEYLFSEMSALLNGLASPVRLKIIHFLTQAPHSVEQLAQKLGQSIANTSMHLKKMQRENILKTENLGQKRIYSLAQVEMKEFWEQIQQFALKHNELNIISSKNIYHEELDWDKNVQDTLKMIKAKKVIVLDVRPNDEVESKNEIYEKFVLHIPFGELKKRSGELPKTKIILVVCRGRLCVMSNESAFVLRKLGFEAFKLNSSWFQLSQMLSEA